MPTDGGKVTDITGLVSRVVQGARQFISGVSPSNWFGPGQPLATQSPPDTLPRRWDYSTTVNLNYTPRSSEATSYEDLRALADNCDILRAVIETRKDQIEAQSWQIRVKVDDNKKIIATDDQKNRIKAVTEFLRNPDKEDGWTQWLRTLLEDMFVLDAIAIEKVRDRAGRLYSLDLLDGATIKPLIDIRGKTPLPPDPAYQQIIKGVPAVDFTRDELIFLRHNRRTNKLYGYSHVEQIILTVNIAIRRAIFQLDYYKDGSQPDAFFSLPKEWKTDQIREFQKIWDAMLSGNLSARRRLRFVPGEGKYTPAKEIPMKDEYDEWLARIICYVFSVAPTPFTKSMNRATADNAHDQALEEGLAPLLKRITHIINPILQTEFNSPDLEFAWIDDREQDPQTQSTILTGYVTNGIMAIDEAREKLGEDPVGGAAAHPMVKTATGFVPLGGSSTPADGTPAQNVEDPEKKKAQNEAAIDRAKNPPAPVPVAEESKKDDDKKAEKLAKKKLAERNPYYLTRS